MSAPAAISALNSDLATLTSELDSAVARLRTGSELWAQLTLDQRITLLRAVRTRTAAVMDQWVAVAAEGKGLHPGHPLIGEEWLSGPYGLLGALDAAIVTLKKLSAGQSPLSGVEIVPAPGNRVKVRAFPLTRSDRFLLAGFRGEVWLQPGITAVQASSSAGLAQRTPTKNGGVGLVLGAGNITAIPVLDVLSELLAHNRVSILKLNPTQAALYDIFTEVFEPLINLNLLSIVNGDAQVGAYLTSHPGIDHVHITGSEASFNAIVWGADSQAQQRREQNAPRLDKPITAELGGVSPIIVVPGAWSEADIAFQAAHVATMRLHNSGHNCLSGQVVLISRDWPQRDYFLAALRRAYALAPDRPVWYPGAQEKMAEAKAHYPTAIELAGRLLVELRRNPGTPSKDTPDPATLAAQQIEQTEYFAPVLGITDLTGQGREFLDRAVEHANQHLYGTLGANIIIDPRTQRQLGSGFEKALARLKYGTIAINTWTALGFLTPTLSWGAFPGNTLQDAGSGIGTVHNMLLLDGVERTVVSGPFRPFPRMLGDLLRGGRFTILPTPPWFVSSQTGTEVSAGLTRFRAHGRVRALVRTLFYALRA